MAIDENKTESVGGSTGQIEKQFGKGSIMRLGEDRSMDVETISTGSLSLDIALGQAVCRWAVSSKSTDRNLPVKPR